MINESNNAPTQRPHIAYFSPFPPVRSGISDYSSELLPYLSNYVDITLFAADPQKVDPTLAAQFSIDAIENYPAQRWQYDIPLYQIGNSVHHEAIYQMCLRYPGLVTLHDYSLYHFMTQRTLGQHDIASYMRELGYGEGERGLIHARQIRLGAEIPALHTIPFNKRLLDLNLGIIVHSRYAQELISAQNPNLAVTVIPQHIISLNEKSQRHRLPWPQDAVIFASVGQVTSAKQIEFALRAFKKTRAENENVYYLLVGEETGDVDVPGMIQSLALSDSVQHVGYVADKQEFVDWIFTADIVINLRYPTIGETSATALRALAAGRALVVFDHGWYSELPDDSCIKIPLLDETALVSVMSQLAQHSHFRQQLGEYGRQYIKNEHLPNYVAKAYASFIYDQLGRLRSRFTNSDFDESQ